MKLHNGGSRVLLTHVLRVYHHNGNADDTDSADFRGL
jgi:hypothetical protein